MADLGTLTTKKGGDRCAPAYKVPGWLSGKAAPISVNHWKKSGRPVPFWTLSPTQPISLAVSVAGIISGTVKEGAVAVPYSWVHLYYRPSGEKISSIKTDVAGNFSFSGLEVDQSKYFVVALDPDGGTVYNALIYDRVVPVGA